MAGMKNMEAMLKSMLAAQESLTKQVGELAARGRARLERGGNLFNGLSWKSYRSIHLLEVPLAHPSIA